jgi:pyrroloquinoline quinone biosynthesis protein B
VPSHLAELASNHPEATAGVRITETRSGRRLVYLPGARRLDEAAWAELEAADCAFVDGTFFTEDELARVRPGAPPATEMGHEPIASTLARLARLRGRRLYTHVNNTNPVLDARSPERRAVEAAGVEVASDGLELEL